MSVNCLVGELSCSHCTYDAMICMLGNFPSVFFYLQNYNFSKMSSVSNGLDPDLGPNCYQRLSVESDLITWRQKVIWFNWIHMVTSTSQVRSLTNWVIVLRWPQLKSVSIKKRLLTFDRGEIIYFNLSLGGNHLFPSIFFQKEKKSRIIFNLNLSLETFLYLSWFS